MYSQNSEEKWILDQIKTLTEGEYIKSFLDCGAYAPKVFSNTRCLVECGWSGTYIEPAPSNFDQFLKEYRDNPAITLVNAAVAAESKLVEFYDSGGDALSTMSTSHVELWSPVVKFRKYLTKTITWDELLAAVSDKFSVLSLDVEGLNKELFDLLPLNRLTYLKIIVVEHQGYQSEMTRRAKDYGFTAFDFNGENLMLCRK
jgi:FkbM family methyltransferase